MVYDVYKKDHCVADASLSGVSVRRYGNMPSNQSLVYALQRASRCFELSVPFVMYFRAHGRPEARSPNDVGGTNGDPIPGQVARWVVLVQ